MAPSSALIADRPCPVCGSRRREPLHPMDFQLPEGSPLPVHYDIAACTDCGMVYANTPGSQADYDRYYADHSKYEDPTVGTGGGNDPLDRRRLEQTADLVMSYLPVAAAAARVVDIGCANGGLLVALHERGMNALFGVDPSDACVARLTQQGIAGVQGRATALPQTALGGKFDLIILSHVLEHVVDVATTMEAVREQLAPQGRIYIEVPDASRYLDFPFVPFYFFDSEHINHFDAAALRQLARAHGMHAVDTGTRNIELTGGSRYPAVWAVFAHGSATSTTDTDGTRLKERLQAYIAAQSTRATYPELSTLAESGVPVALWGAGSYAQRLLAQSRLKECKVITVVDKDRNKQGRQFLGRAIADPAVELRGIGAETVIVVAAAVHGHAIAEEIRAMGIRNRIVIPHSEVSP